MPSINMIASRRAEKKRQEQNVRKLVYGISAEIGCILLVLSILSVKMGAVHSRITDLSDQIQKLEPKVNQIDQLEKETASLTPKVTTLNGAKADTLFWYSNIASITASLPERAWLTSLAAAGNSSTPGSSEPGSASGGDPTVQLSGITLTQAQVGEAMLRMNQSPGLDHIDLAFVQQQKTDDADTVAFQMTVHLKPEPSAQGASDDKKS